MIISASRRTDIPAFYSAWFMRRLAEGRFLVPHPRAAGRLGLVQVNPDNLDAIVFWTKNPEPMLDQLKGIDQLGYRYYFSFTLTAYGPEIERNLPPKDRLVDTFQRLAERIGPERVDWRFDPILIDDRHSSAWHLDRFGELSRRLRAYTSRCIINFVKGYRHLPAGVREAEESSIRELAAGLVRVAAEQRLPLFNCTERRNLEDLGLRGGACIDRRKIEHLVGSPIRARKDPGQPRICRCLESVDIGVYDSCVHGCLYCYAVANRARAQRRLAEHDPEAPMLTGYPRGGETVSDRSGPSWRVDQKRLF